MNITQATQIVDLEEEDPREQVNIYIVESGTNNEEVEEEIKLPS